MPPAPRSPRARPHGAFLSGPVSSLESSGGRAQRLGAEKTSFGFRGYPKPPADSSTSRQVVSGGCCSVVPEGLFYSTPPAGNLNPAPSWAARDLASPSSSGAPTLAEAVDGPDPPVTQNKVLSVLPVPTFPSSDFPLLPARKRPHLPLFTGLALTKPSPQSPPLTHLPSFSKAWLSNPHCPAVFLRRANGLPSEF